MVEIDERDKPAVNSRYLINIFALMSTCRVISIRIKYANEHLVISNVFFQDF